MDGQQLVNQFQINGHPIFLKGGNWIGTDGMLRYLDPDRYHNEVQMNAEMNFNLLRVWGGGITERPEFYDACDELGILVMQEFWLSSEYNPLQPTDSYVEVFKACAQDAIKALRNHPSLFLWCAANECEPPDKIKTALQEYIGPNGSLDQSRMLIFNSLRMSGNDRVPIGDGPYGILKLDRYCNWLGDDRNTGWDNPCNPEIGSLGVPTVESLQIWMPQEAMANFPTKNRSFTDLNPDSQSEKPWWYHSYSDYFVNYELPSKDDQIYTYGAPTSIEEFSERAQLASYMHYKGLWEGHLAHMWDRYTGLLIWKSQNPYPGLRAQLYDWYLEQTGGYWGSRHACEPVHVQLNLKAYPNSFDVMVVNHTAQKIQGLSLKAVLYYLSGTEVKIFEGNGLNVDACSVKTFKSNYSPQPPISSVYFVRLELTDARQDVVSRNFYWLNSSYTTDKTFESLKQLRNPPTATTTTGIRLRPTRGLVGLTLRNEQSTVSFWNRIQIRVPLGDDKDSHTKRLVPVFFPDNYISLSPSEERQIGFEVDFKEWSYGRDPQVWIKSWNAEWQQVPLAWGPLPSAQ